MHMAGWQKLLFSGFHTFLLMLLQTYCFSGTDKFAGCLGMLLGNVTKTVKDVIAYL